MEKYFKEDGKFYRWIVFPSDDDCSCEDNSVKQEITEAQYWKGKFLDKEKECFRLYADIRKMVQGGRNWYEKGQIESKYLFMFASEDLMFMDDRKLSTTAPNGGIRWQILQEKKPR